MNQEIQSILARVDHTLLAQSATWNEIKAICDDGVKCGCASVCIPASYVKQRHDRSTPHNCCLRCRHDLLVR